MGKRRRFFTDQHGFTDLIRILLTDDDLRGAAVRIALPAATTVGVLLDDLQPGCRIDEFIVHVNRRPADAGDVLRDGDRVTIKSVDVQSCVYLG